jgi:hypothetical protein
MARHTDKIAIVTGAGKGLDGEQPSRWPERAPILLLPVATQRPVVNVLTLGIYRRYSEVVPPIARHANVATNIGYQTLGVVTLDPDGTVA